KDFIILNNKIQQKRSVRYTPKWHLIENFNELQTIPNKHDFYVKRGIGSGGFTVFKLDTLQGNEKFSDLLNLSDERYLEEKEYGECMSIQLCKTDSQCIVFGLTKQHIKEEKEFCGAEIIDINILSKNLFLREKLHTCINDLCEKLLSSYTGFFGIDFIYDEKNQTFGFLEGNIRLTAMTIPTLIYNKNSLQHIFKEDVDKEAIKESDLILGYDTAYKCYDILTNE
ncbi:MAG: ATP-grasp domain-containing protein, partial [Candidatus Absconditabacterales bacterium]